jgi:hypothetical protein
MGVTAESAVFPAESALFVDECNFQCLSPVARNTYKGHSFIAQNQNFPQKKALANCTKPKIFSRFFATRKDVESYSQMPGKRMLALEFSNFSGEARHLLSG